MEKFRFPGCNAGVRFRNLTRDLNKSPGTSIRFLGAKLGMRVFTAQRRKHDLLVSVESRGASYVTDPHGHTQHSPRPIPVLAGLCELRAARGGRTITKSVPSSPLRVPLHYAAAVTQSQPRSSHRSDHNLNPLFQSATTNPRPSAHHPSIRSGTLRAHHSAVIMGAA